MYRMGNVPRRGEESELFPHSITRNGFFGPYANVYKTRNPGEPIRWDPRLGPASIDVTRTEPSDFVRADGTPMPLLTNGDITVSVSRRREAMPFCWRNVDGDELFFIHRGTARFETEMGWIEAEPGDMILLPRNVVYRVIPHTDDAVHLIIETRSMLEIAEKYHRDHGETNSGLDLSLIVVPEPGDTTIAPQSEYEVRLKLDDELYSMFFDYDPVGVTAGWAGDPIVFKLSGWDVPCASLPSTPPTAAVFITGGSEAVVTVHTPSRGRGGGPPAHTNDYDEIWFLHSPSPEARGGRFGLLRWEPQGLTQAGFRRTDGEGPSRPAEIPVINFNIDVKARLHLTKEAEAFLSQQPSAVGALA